MIALSCNDADMHACWIKDIEAYGKLDTSKRFPFIIVDDQDRQIAKIYGMIDPAETDSKGMPLTARAVFVIGPDKKLKLSILYPATTRSKFQVFYIFVLSKFDLNYLIDFFESEILRVIDSLQMVAKNNDKIATPVDWNNGDACMIHPGVKPEEADALFPKGYQTFEVPSQKSYLRLTPQP